MATIKDIVRETGFGLGTVSRALNNHPKVKAETRKIILDTAQRLGFIPNQAARSLGAKQDPLLSVGLVIPHLTYSFYTEVIKGIYTALRGKAVRLTLHAIFEDEQKEAELDSLLAQGNENALIIVSMKLTERQKRMIGDRGISVVLVDTPDDDFSFVAVDNQLGGKIAAKHLASLKLESFAFLGDSYRSRQAVEREQAFVEELQRVGIEDVIVRQSHINEENLDVAIPELLDELTFPAGIAFYSDLMAYRAIEHCNRRGLIIGKDIHLLGYDDLPYSKLLGLSTVAQSMQDLGEQAALQIISKKPAEKGKWLKPKLILRNTSPAR